ncbi:hypothetical protein BJ741DRAFT_660837 [Chytriomyces cf. hyalinus JEL632]|nr:hypothetical protein BJ741DRAFT_660837 [Chytriomyces cf. hyalinus JEL632]
MPEGPGLLSTFCLVMAGVSFVQLLCLIVFILRRQNVDMDLPKVTLKTAFTPFNSSLALSATSLLIIYLCGSILFVPSAETIKLHKVADIVRAAFFVAFQLGFIHFSYHRGKELFDQVFPEILTLVVHMSAKYLGCVVAAVMVLQLATLLPLDSSSLNILSAVAGWCEVATLLVTLLMDITFLAGFILYLRLTAAIDLSASTVNILNDPITKIIANHGVVASSLVFAAVGLECSVLLLSSYNDVLEVCMFSTLSIATGVLGALKLAVHRDKINKRKVLLQNLEIVLGLVEMKRIQERHSVSASSNVGIETSKATLFNLLSNNIEGEK